MRGHQEPLIQAYEVRKERPSISVSIDRVAVPVLSALDDDQADRVQRLTFGLNRAVLAIAAFACSMPGRAADVRKPKQGLTGHYRRWKRTLLEAA